MRARNMLSAAMTVAVAAFLVGCNSTEDTLTVPNPNSTANAPQLPNVATAPAPSVQTASGTVQNTVVANAPAATGTAQVYFAPIVGAPVDKVTALSRRLSNASPQRGIALQPSRSATITHEIRGYFSALSEETSTTVIHVWDVFAPNGQRVHRIQAQESVPGTGDDPWTVVPSATMEQIADKVLAEYTAWRAS
ncbi:MAG: hypothetical protein AAGG69_00845 [Pseudomonadota bacterium]